MLPPLNLTARLCHQAEVAGPGVHEKAAEQGEHHPRHRQGRHNLKDRARQVQGGLTAILFNVFFCLICPSGPLLSSQKKKYAITEIWSHEA